MTAEQYKPIYHWFSAHPAVKRLVVFLDRWLPLVPFVCYPVLLCLLNIRLSRLFLTQKQACLLYTSYSFSGKMCTLSEPCSVSSRSSSCRVPLGSAS